MLLRSKILKNLSRCDQRMLIVGMINTRQEAMEIQDIAKRFVIGNRARFLAQQIRK